MIGYVLNLDQKEEIQGKFYAPYEFFNCVQDIDGDWFLILSDKDKSELINTGWEWILSLPFSEYVPPPPPPLPQF
jgi:hypothetical protein